MPKVKRIHFVCKDNANVTERPAGIFVSGYWKLSPDVALSVEQVYLHESRDAVSYRQGTVVERYLIPHENGMRYIFACEPLEDTHVWEGRSGYGY